MPTYYEFFAGGGMARAGLGEDWTCLFANDFDRKKAQTYALNWGGDDLVVEDVRKLTCDQLPGEADLVWASFPCQDLSLAGGGAGLRGDRSGTFWPFWGLMESLGPQGRQPKIIVLENVTGTLTSHSGTDFASICNALAQEGYRFGAIVIDAANFVPQSRPRLFIVAVKAHVYLPQELVGDQPTEMWHTKALRTAYSTLSGSTKASWIWWNLPPPMVARASLASLIEEHPTSTRWHEPEETQKLLAMMSPRNLTKVREAQASGHRKVGTIYKRTRRDENGDRIQRAEVRFDDLAGCLRTPAGGSSRQLILVVEGESIRSRLLSSREAARLMGLPDSYTLPANYNEAYHLTGDGVVVPVVSFLRDSLLTPVATLSPALLEAQPA